MAFQGRNNLIRSRIPRARDVWQLMRRRPYCSDHRQALARLTKSRERKHVSQFQLSSNIAKHWLSAGQSWPAKIPPFEVACHYNALDQVLIPSCAEQRETTWQTSDD